MDPSEQLFKAIPDAPAFPELPPELQDLDTTIVPASDKSTTTATLTPTPVPTVASKSIQPSASLSNALSDVVPSLPPEIPVFPEGPDDTEVLSVSTPVTLTPDTADKAATTTPAAKQKKVIEPIFYDLEPSPTADSTLKARVVQERQKQLDRLLRFSVQQDTTTTSVSMVDVTSTASPSSSVDAAPVKQRRVTETMVLGAKRAAVRRGFATGFDTTSAEEASKRKARIERFGPLEQHPFYKPDDDPYARDARQQRFGEDLVAAATQSNQNQLLPAKTLEVRRNVDASEVRRQSVIHLYGVDKLSTRDVVSHFDAYGPSWCEWLNDSACNVVFEDAYTMHRALRGLTVGTIIPNQSADVGVGDDGEGDNPHIIRNEKVTDDDMEMQTDEKTGKEEKEEVKKEEKKEEGKKEEGKEDGEKKEENEMTEVAEKKESDDENDMDTSNDDGRESPEDTLWRAIKPFVKKGVSTPLWGRMATTKDVRPHRPNPQSKWSRTMRKLKGETELTLDGTGRRKNTKKEHGVSKDRNSISKNLSKKSIKMEL